jgi:hypothetical protein
MYRFRILQPSEELGFMIALGGAVFWKDRPLFFAEPRRCPSASYTSMRSGTEYASLEMPSGIHPGHNCNEDKDHDNDCEENEESFSFA